MTMTRITLRFFLRSRKGSMLMEYVLLQALVAMGIGIGGGLLSWGYGDVYDYSVGMGPLGGMMQCYFQRILGGLSLPVP